MCQMGNKVEKITKKCSIMRMRIKMIGYRRSYDQFLYITLYVHYKFIFQSSSMEYRQYSPDFLCLDTKERNILDYYGKSEQEKNRKAKFQLYNFQNIQGLFATLNIQTSYSQFLPFEDLCSEITSFLQSSKRICKPSGSKLRLEKGNFIVFLDGSLSKVLQNHMVNQSMEGNFVSRVSLKDKKVTKECQALAKKFYCKKYYTSSEMLPVVITSDLAEFDDFQALSETTYLLFSNLSLQKLQKWIEIKQKQSVSLFISHCLGLQNKKALLKLSENGKKVQLTTKEQFAPQVDCAYFIFRGRVILKTKNYQINLNQKSMIYKANQGSEEKVSGLSNTLMIKISLGELESSSQDFDNNLVNQVRRKLEQLVQEREKTFRRSFQILQYQVEKEPQFKNPHLTFKQFEIEKQNSTYEQKKNSVKRYIIPKVFSNQNSKRFRASKTATSDIVLESESSIFLSNYPYVKMVESQEKVQGILNQSLQGAYISKTNNFVKEKVCEVQRKKIEKQIKRLYYKDKVRRLKIKNIAERQIPNGHKKIFDSAKAEKEIHDNSLFQNIIEYPVDGVSKDAVKQSLHNRKIISKFEKISIASQGNIGQEQSQKNIEKTLNKFNEIKIKQQFDTLKQLEGSIQDFPFCQVNERVVGIMSQKLQVCQDKDSFYYNKILNPHLPIQRITKSKFRSQNEERKGQYISKRKYVKGKQNLGSIQVQQKSLSQRVKTIF